MQREAIGLIDVLGIIVFHPNGGSAVLVCQICEESTAPIISFQRLQKCQQ